MCERGPTREKFLLKLPWEVEHVAATRWPRFDWASVWVKWSRKRGEYPCVSGRGRTVSFINHSCCWLNTIVSVTNRALNACIDGILLYVRKPRVPCTYLGFLFELRRLATARSRDIPQWYSNGQGDSKSSFWTQNHRPHSKFFGDLKLIYLTLMNIKNLKEKVGRIIIWL